MHDVKKSSPDPPKKPKWKEDGSYEAVNADDKDRRARAKIILLLDLDPVNYVHVHWRVSFVVVHKIKHHTK